jgi:hypothetical protein
MTVEADLLRAWSVLSDDLDGGREAVERCVLSCVADLEDGLTTVAYALVADDLEGARTELVTMHHTSHMIGAHALARLAARALDTLDRGAQAAARDLMPARAVLDELLRAVEVQLPSWNGGAARAHRSRARVGR